MKFLRTTAVTATLLTFTIVTVASAAPAPTWRNAQLVVLPAGASGIPSGYLPTLSCASAGNCEAAGAYAHDNSVEGLVINETNGRWTAPVTLAAPSGAASNPGITIFGLSCGGVGTCVAAGDFRDRNGDTEALLANEVTGTWSKGVTVTLPANALLRGQDALVRSVSCTSPGNCSAVGSYLDNDRVNPRNQGFVTSEVHGVWARANEITTTQANFDPFVTMDQIACASSGTCSAVGSFVDSHGVTQGLIESEVRGLWRAAVTLGVPANASTFRGVNVSEVACAARSSCALLGTYNATNGDVEALSATGTNGHWSRARELTMPTNAATNPHVFLYGFNGIACASSGQCAAGGQYRDASGNYQGFLDVESKGTWSRAVTLPLPAGASSTGKNGGVIALTCPRAGACRAGAAYLDSSNNYQALVVSQRKRTWSLGVKVVLPHDAASVGVDGGIYTLVCLTTTSCTGVGTFLASATTYQGFTLAGS